MSIFLKKHIEEITSISDSEFEYVLSHFTKKRLKKKQFLVQNNSYINEDYFVNKGLLKAYYTNDEGKDRILQFATEGWWITDYQAYFKREKATINIDCLEDCELLSISLEDRNKICAELHKIEYFFRIKSHLGYVALQQRILSLLDKSAQARYFEFVKRYPTILQRIPKTVLASYLGVTRETLSRLPKM